MSTNDAVDRILRSRAERVECAGALPTRGVEAEGGCGVVGMASSVPLGGRHLMPAALQMHNRGNGKGGGVAATALSAAQMRVSPQVLREATLLQVACLDPAAHEEVEASHLAPTFDVLQGYRIPSLDDYRQVPGLEVRPPDVWRYFVRVKPQVLAQFAAENGLEDMDPRAVEDEVVYQTSFALNQRLYASLGEKRAFVLCHGRDLMVLKIVGYAEQAAQYYCLEDLQAHVWIAHQRYPTKGRVWHPGGAHPFVGLNEALVHNGDFANYHAVCTYLRQRNIRPLFLTDTEVSALLFDLWDRVYRYPLEVIIEALAPTTERDFDLLPPEKQRLYRAIQATHIHASPDGPWFFIIARSRPDQGECQLLGITDTAMLRPQVFALFEATAKDPPLQVGLIASEKQAIDATLQSLHAENPRVCPIADRYWSARGGSHTDGGAFAFTLQGDTELRTLVCTDKFGRRVTTPADQWHNNPTSIATTRSQESRATPMILRTRGEGDPDGLGDDWQVHTTDLARWNYGDLAQYCQRVLALSARGDRESCLALAMLTRLRDSIWDPGSKRRASVLAMVDKALLAWFEAVPVLATRPGRPFCRVNWAERRRLRPPKTGESTLVIDVSAFAAEGEDSAARFLVAAYQQGWCHLLTYGWRGQRFCGCGLGPSSERLRIEVYGSSGDYLGSGLDGAKVYVHGSAQDQVGQILKHGKLVVYGDVGQTFMYGAKGGEAYVLGNAAGRPLINAAGRPKVVINGTCLDYLAESFMAGDPLRGGGFVLLNGVAFDDHGRMVELPTPYPGGNLFSLASGGAIYIRDPHRVVDEGQLNGGRFVALTPSDWALIQPYLEENARLFGIGVGDLLTTDGALRTPQDVYRKVAPATLEMLT